MKDLLSLFAESYLKTNSKEKKSREPKEKKDSYYFTRVNSKYESMLEKHREFYNTPDFKIKQTVIGKCLEQLENEGYTKKMYLSRLRDTMTDFVLNLSFLLECRDLKLDPFNTAQNMVICYKHRKALKDGIAVTFKNKLDLLKEPLFSEAELADAKFSDVEGYATKAQKTQLSTLIERAMKILPDSEDDLNEKTDK